MEPANRPAMTGTMLILALLACSILLAAPAAAATRTLGSGPSFTAAVVGTNEFVPGQDATIRILVRNTGLNDFKQVGVGTIEPEDRQNTAKTVTLGLTSDSDLITIRTDPQMIGDIPSGGAVTAEFAAKISSNATASNYTLPLNISCQYLPGSVQERADEFEFRYNRVTTSIPISIRVKPQVKIDVIAAEPELLAAGAEGYINLTIRNAGPEYGEQASVKLLRNGQSPIIPTDNTVFVGDYPPDGTVTCRYKVAISKDATNQTYPVDVAVSYTNREGVVVTSEKATVGVPVHEKPGFSVVSAIPAVSPNSDQVIDVVYRNDGALPVTAAMARIVQHVPVSTSDNTAYLGDIAPGATASARFVVHADSAAEPGPYTLESTIRYRDTAGTSLESDTIPVAIRIVPAASGLAAIPGGMMTIAGAIAVIVIGIGYLLYRKKQTSP